MVNRTRKANILSEILEYCDQDTQTRLIKGLTPFLIEQKRPDILNAIKSRIILFEDLAYANPAGLTLLLKYVTPQDLAIAFIGAPDNVVKSVALCMSKNMFNDLKSEIALHRHVSKKEIEKARERILREVKQLVHENRLYLEKPNEQMVY